MLINALQRANDVQRAELTCWIEAENYNPQEKIQVVTALYDAIGIKELCHEKIETYFQAAARCLDNVKVDAARKEILQNFAASLMGRKA